jgi:hypothetical protein
MLKQATHKKLAQNMVRMNISQPGIDKVQGKFDILIFYKG